MYIGDYTRRPVSCQDTDRRFFDLEGIFLSGKPETLQVFLSYSLRAIFYGIFFTYTLCSLFLSGLIV